MKMSVRFEVGQNLQAIWKREYAHRCDKVVCRSDLRDGVAASYGLPMVVEVGGRFRTCWEVPIGPRMVLQKGVDRILRNLNLFS